MIDGAKKVKYVNAGDLFKFYIFHACEFHDFWTRQDGRTKAVLFFRRAQVLIWSVPCQYYN